MWLWLLLYDASAILNLEDIQLALDFHNAARKIVNPPASDMLALIWDPILAHSAQQWADTCPTWEDFAVCRRFATCSAYNPCLDHATGVCRELNDVGRCNEGLSLCQTFRWPDPAFGQNTAFIRQASSLTTGNWTLPCLGLGSNLSATALACAMKSWQGYAPKFRINSRSKLCEHGNCEGLDSYLQMIFSNTSKVGCGLAKCDTLVVVCRYDQAPKGGNRDRPYTLGSSCATCPERCHDNLCLPACTSATTCTECLSPPRYSQCSWNSKRRDCTEQANCRGKECQLIPAQCAARPTPVRSSSHAELLTAALSFGLPPSSSPFPSTSTNHGDDEPESQSEVSTQTQTQATQTQAQTQTQTQTQYPSEQQRQQRLSRHAEARFSARRATMKDGRALFPAILDPPSRPDPKAPNDITAEADIIPDPSVLAPMRPGFVRPRLDSDAPGIPGDIHMHPINALHHDDSPLAEAQVLGPVFPAASEPQVFTSGVTGRQPTTVDADDVPPPPPPPRIESPIPLPAQSQESYPPPPAPRPVIHELVKGIPDVTSVEVPFAPPVQIHSANGIGAPKGPWKLAVPVEHGFAPKRALVARFREEALRLLKKAEQQERINGEEPEETEQ